MEQHPVPQNISSYQFHLVGDMTLKQFLELAAGVVIGVIIYATGLPGIIKWPLILFFSATGAALAFVPFEERPLEQWIFAFFRSVYSPTIFNWEKRESVKYFQDEPIDANASLGLEKPTKTSAFSKIPFLNKLEESENSYLSKLAGLFVQQPQILNTATAQPLAEQPVSQPVQVISPVGHTTSPSFNSLVSKDEGSVLTTHPQDQTKVDASDVSSQKRDLQIPQTTFISLDKSVRPHVVLEETPAEKVDLETTSVTPTLSGQQIAEGQSTQAIFSLDAAPPSLPTIINTVSGQVMDHDKKIIEGAILEITDENGRPVRALKTNRAGHFLIVTPLMDGKYKILIEKEWLAFDPIEFEANGKIIDPIAITARASL